MTDISSRLSFDDAMGHMDFSKRGEQKEGGLCEVIRLVEGESVPVNLEVRQGEDDGDGALVELRAYHIENGEGDAYHGCLSLLLSWSEVRQLHRYLAFLLSDVG